MYIEQFLQRFDDQHLANLQCACEDGRLVYRDPCNCLLHHFRGEYRVTKWESEAAELARQAEIEFFQLPGVAKNLAEYTGFPLKWASSTDDIRRRALLPLIHAEWARRIQQRVYQEEMAQQINEMPEFTEPSPAVR